MRSFLLALLIFSAAVCFGGEGKNPQKLESELQERLSAHQKDSTTIDLLKNLSHHYFEVEPLKGIEYAEKAMQIARENNDKEIKGDIFNYFGNFYRDQGLLDLALQAHLNSLEISEEIGDAVRLAYALNDLGNIYYDKGDFERALKHYKRAATISDTTENHPALAVSYNNIGLAYHQMEQYDMSFSFFAKALQLREEQGIPELIGHSFNYIGMVYRTQGNYRLATQYFGKALKKFKKSENQLRIGDTYFNIGLNWAKQKDFQTAIQCFTRAEKHYKEIENQIALTHLYEEIGKTQMEAGMLSSATRTLEKALKMAHENGFRGLEKETLLLLSKAEELNGNHKSALGHFKSYSTLKDSLSNNEINAQMARLEAAFSYRQKEKQLALAQKENEIRAEKLAAQRFKLKIMLIALAILISGLFLYFLLRLTPKQRQFMGFWLKNKLANARFF